MKPIRDIIVKVPKAYKTELKLKCGLVLFMDENIKQVKDTIRYGEIVAIPDGLEYDIQVGDTVFFHHNIVAVTVMEDGDVQSQFLVDKSEGLYRIPLDKSWPMLYAKIKDEEFIPLEGTCFVRPIVDKPTNAFETEDKVRRHYGEMVYPCQSLIDAGIVKGTTVVFEKDSEYEFNVGDETLYRMFDSWILASV